MENAGLGGVNRKKVVVGGKETSVRGMLGRRTGREGVTKAQSPPLIVD